MPYNDEQFNQDIETALRMESGFQGPITDPNYVAPPTVRKSYSGPEGTMSTTAPHPGVSDEQRRAYDRHQYELSRPRQIARGEDIEHILGLDKYIFEKEKANIGPERAMANWDTRLKVRQAETEAREEATRGRELHEAKLMKSAAESEKALGEAAEARSKAQGGMPIKTDIDMAVQGTLPQQPGESREAYANRVAATRNVQAGGKAGAVEAGKLTAPTAITPAQQKETAERGIRMNQTEAALSPKIWDKAIQGWTAPGMVTGSISNLAEAMGYLPPEQGFLYTVIDKMGAVERHDFFGANFTPGEAAIARQIIPNRRMHPKKLQQVLEMNLMIDQWSEAFEIEMADKPRGSKAWLQAGAEFRKAYPFPVNSKQAAVFKAPQQKINPADFVGKPPNTYRDRETGRTVTWDGQKIISISGGG